MICVSYLSTVFTFPNASFIPRPDNFITINIPYKLPMMIIKKTMNTLNKLLNRKRINRFLFFIHGLFPLRLARRYVPKIIMRPFVILRASMAHLSDLETPYLQSKAVYSPEWWGGWLNLFRIYASFLKSPINLKAT